MIYFREALYKHGKRGYCSTQCKKRPLYLIRLKHTKHSLVEEGEIQISRTQIFAPHFRHIPLEHFLILRGVHILIPGNGHHKC